MSGAQIIKIAFVAPRFNVTAVELMHMIALLYCFNFYNFKSTSIAWMRNYG